MKILIRTMHNEKTRNILVTVASVSVVVVEAVTVVEPVEVPRPRVVVVVVVAVTVAEPANVLCTVVVAAYGYI
jgi:hypothetical protein